MAQLQSKLPITLSYAIQFYLLLLLLFTRLFNVFNGTMYELSKRTIKILMEECKELQLSLNETKNELNIITLVKKVCNRCLRSSF